MKWGFHTLLSLLEAFHSGLVPRADGGSESVDLCSQEELEQKLLNGGCQRTGHSWRNGVIWVRADGVQQSVPTAPPNGSGYTTDQVSDVLLRMGVLAATSH